ncbi:MAG TPA: tRNA preQ1(34) S-adenosylmethionine ribosyltransferase-isomerase QueA [Chloroflexota bacterium]|nr:tRNA preQ1(34) S-adenosylmethionine ribosyltransferase-isomerase QueA [Chloroflexota bacterium]
MRTADFDYSLPPELIAQQPVERRDASRLLVVDRARGALAHRHFADLPDYLRAGDLLVINDSKVLPARLHGVRLPGGGAVEVLLIHPTAPDHWLVLARPAKRLRAGDRLCFGEGALTATVRELGEEGQRILAFDTGGRPLEALLDTLGEMPLPPYIHERLADPDRYQTVYARAPGSVAAPTAGLHFTSELLQRLQHSGVEVRAVTLHVGLGTFRPVQAERIEEHQMHAEYGVLSAETAAALHATRARGGRVVAVGTTAMRVLESAALQQAHGPWSGWTNIFIYPGFTFRACDALITNFHLPRSTLLMLVSAFAGKALIDRAYTAAIAERYRFFSFGDAMLIL